MKEKLTANERLANNAGHGGHWTVEISPGGPCDAYILLSLNWKKTFAQAGNGEDPVPVSMYVRR